MSVHLSNRNEHPRLRPLVECGYGHEISLAHFFLLFSCSRSFKLLFLLSINHLYYVFYRMSSRHINHSNTAPSWSVESSRVYELYVHVIWKPQFNYEMLLGQRSLWQICALNSGHCVNLSFARIFSPSTEKWVIFSARLLLKPLKAVKAIMMSLVLSLTICSREKFAQ